MGNFDDFKEEYNDRINFKSAILGHAPGDLPFLQELGIDLSLIKIESMLPIKVLRNTGFKPSSSTDLTGPIIFLILFTTFLILHGKIHFGYIYLISLSACSFIYLLLSLITPNGVSLIVCCSVMGYSMIPVLGFSMLNLGLVWMGLPIRIFLGLVLSLWSTYTASTVLCRCYELNNKALIVGYPLELAYLCFVLMVLF